MATKLTLTFDNGPTPGVTDKVLDILHEYSLPATFFVIGEKAATPDGRDLMAAAHAAGHWIGNHTMHHLEPLGTWSDQRAALAEVTDTELVIDGFAHPDRLFRPTGHGSIGPHLFAETTLGHVRTERHTVVLWSLFVRDSKMPQGWEQRALDRVGERDWDVLVVHDLPTGAIDTLPAFLDTVLARGVEIVQQFPEHCLPVQRGELTAAAGVLLPPIPG